MTIDDINNVDLFMKKNFFYDSSTSCNKRYFDFFMIKDPFGSRSHLHVFVFLFCFFFSFFVQHLMHGSWDMNSTLKQLSKVTITQQ